MKISKITVVLLSAVILMQTVSLLLVEAGFQANQSFIATALCINRDKPQMHCEGKCVLKKELNSQQEKETQRTIHQNFSFIFFCEDVRDYTFLSNHHEVFHPAIGLFLSSGFYGTAERPPGC